jgi:hypothetical protein
MNQDELREIDFLLRKKVNQAQPFMRRQVKGIVELHQHGALVLLGDKKPDIYGSANWHRAARQILVPQLPKGVKGPDPDRKPDLPFVLTLARFAAVLVLAWDAHERATGQRDPIRGRENPNCAFMEKAAGHTIHQSPFGYQEKVGDWIENIIGHLELHKEVWIVPAATEKMLHMAMADMQAVGSEEITARLEAMPLEDMKKELEKDETLISATLTMAEVSSWRYLDNAKSIRAGATANVHRKSGQSVGEPSYA